MIYAKTKANTKAKIMQFDCIKAICIENSCFVSEILDNERPFQRPMLFFDGICLHSAPVLVAILQFKLVYYSLCSYFFVW